jgi:IPT/TIG domain
MDRTSRSVDEPGAWPARRFVPAVALVASMVLATTGFGGCSGGPGGHSVPGPTAAAVVSPEAQTCNVPVVTGIFPAVGPVSGDHTVTIAGYCFIGVERVYFGRTLAKPVGGNNSDTQATVIIPPGSGTVNVTVVTSIGRSEIRPVDQFTYLLPTAFLSSLPGTSGASLTSP